MKRTVYTGKHTREISFPLGGIGTGSIGLSGYGGLVDWDIFNAPDKGSIRGFTHFAVKAERDGSLLDARVLNSDITKDLGGTIGKNFGYGLNKMTMAGFPHFKSCVFTGEYPIAKLLFSDKAFPGKASLTAFNPFIPLNDADSGIPAAFFEIELKNTTDSEIDYSVAATLESPWSATACEYILKDARSYMYQYQPGCDKESFEYGDMTLATDAGQEEISYQQSWFRGTWWDHIETYWRNFTECKRFTDRKYSEPVKNERGTLCVHKTVKPGESVRVRYIISWNIPNRRNTWDKYTEKNDAGEDVEKPMRNYYSYLFEDSLASAEYSLKNWKYLYRETKKYRDELFSSTLPEEVKDAVSATASVLKTETSIRIGERGDFYGWEGLNQNSGSCEGSCTHVWNYAYTMPFLFPKVERNLRTNDYLYNQHENGQMEFRTRIPFGRGYRGFRACADGQLGGVMKVYRDWKISGDTEWLRSIWDMVKKSVSYAWDKTNEDRWDSDCDGFLDGRAHHTLDMELFGACSWLEGFYLGALKAGAEMAHALCDTETEELYLRLFKSGREKTEALLFNGEYYCQSIDLKDKALLESFGENAVSAYWNEEAGQIKYQIGQGCGIDQVLAQWHADISGLGGIFDEKHLHTALESMIKNNIKSDMRDHYNTFRLFAVNDEGGSVICDYPAGVQKPAIPIPYAQECMHGFEYAFAGLLISRGYISEGLRVVKSVRDRYNGENRNPWNEIECGSNYARSMASYALIPIISGFTFDMTAGLIGFNPKINRDNFRCLWSLDCAWGHVIIKDGLTEIAVNAGKLTVCVLELPYLTEVREVTADGKNIPFAFSDGKVRLETPAVILKKIVIK